MRVHARSWLMALVCAVFLTAVLMPGAAQAAEAPGIEKFVATNCEEEESECGEETVEGFKEPNAVVTEEEAEEEGFTQAGGRVPSGVTDFKVQTIGKYPQKIPTSIVTHIRTDVAPGLATNPFAVPQCSIAAFGAPGSASEVQPGVFAPSACTPETEIGAQDATVYAGATLGDLALHGAVYNLEPSNGLASEFGVALELPESLTGPLPPGLHLFAHTLIEGNVEWGRQANGTDQGDFHDYFEITVSPSLPLVRSRLVFNGTAGNGAFITNATSCPGHNTSTLKVTDKEGTTVPKSFTTPIGLEGCNLLKFEPGVALKPGSSLSDQPDELTAEATEPHDPTTLEQSQVKSASFTLPEGMTLNPSAAHGLEACKPSQAHQEGTVFGPQFGVECPAGSKIGTVTLNVPTLPNGSLEGSVYLAGPQSGPITGEPYDIYVVANSERFGVSVRLLGETFPDEVTGRVTTIFRNPPEQPFSNLSIHFERGVLSPIANPLVCGTPTGSSSFEPTSAPRTAKTAAFGVSVTGCASPLPLALGQSTADQTANAGANTSFTFNLARNDGNQYLGEVKTVLAPGLVGKIPSVTPCEEAPANAGTCAATSQIGTATVLAGSGSTPFAFSGPVYLTNSYHGAPYGLSIAVPAVAGPFNLGTVVTRATINVNPTTAQVEVDSVLPRVFKGIPLRLRNISVAVNKQNFMINPTNCSALTTASTLRGFTLNGGPLEGTQLLSTPFQVGNCSALKFKPVFKASTSSKTSRANGASLTTTITQPSGQSNIRAVKVQLPRQLPSRLTTLQKACTEAVFAANPKSCPSGSFVGGATVLTPTLPGKLTGPAILVSHAGASFPDLDLVLESPSHVRVILTGNTDIKKGITTTTFASTPDVPVSSVSVNLPIGSHSALGSFGSLCTQPLVMPTTITPQNGGAVIKQNTIISVSGCGVRIVGHKVVGNTAFITVQTFAAGRISGGGSGLKTVYRRLSRAFKTVSLKVPLSSGGRSKHKPLHIKLRVGFVPKAKHGARSAATTKVTFR
jgi:hypothetical protein